MRINSWTFAVIVLLGSLATARPALTGPTLPGPNYDADGKLQLPGNYREWVYLSTGFDMSYSPRLQPGHHMFDNVFVEPAAYQAFKKTGSWPDRTMLVLESRGALDKGSFNKAGNYQSPELMGVEIHVKDTKRFASGWAFFAFDDAKPATMIPVAANCYSCHAEHAAVDTTFVQFYPTLLPIADAKSTLSVGYQHDFVAHRPR